MVHKKITEEYVINYINNIGWKLKSKFTDLYTKMDLECNFGHNTSLAWTRINAGCKECKRIERREKEIDKMFTNAKEIATNNGWKILSDGIKNSTDKMDIQCIFGHIFQKNYNKLVKAVECPICFSPKLVSRKQIELELSEIGYKLIDDKHERHHHFLTIECDEHHIINMTLDEIRREHKCKFCVGNYKKDNEMIREGIAKFGYELLGDYTGAKEKIKVKCPGNHIIETTYSVR